MPPDGAAHLGDDPATDLPYNETIGVANYEDRGVVSRAMRLLELLVRVQTKPRFTTFGLAEEFGVSRRTISRDLRTLAEMGVPLRSTARPGEGHSLPRGERRISPSLTVDEALGLILSYECLLRYPVHPFSSVGSSAVAKLRSALPGDVVGELNRLRRHVAVAEPVRRYEAPFLGELLAAALDGTPLEVTYDDSISSGAVRRVIFPYGLYASAGFWYCACFERQRGANVSIRADRFLSAERVEGLEPPPHVTPRGWPHTTDGVGGERALLRARVTERGMTSLELISIFGHIEPDGSGGGTVEVDILRKELDHYASRLLSLGTDVLVESPPELVEVIRDKARQVARLYD